MVVCNVIVSYNDDSDFADSSRFGCLFFGSTLMLVLREKTILVNGQPAKAFSLDSRTWFSNPADFRAFKERRNKVKAVVQDSLAQPSSRDFPVVVPYSWMGFDR